MTKKQRSTISLLEKLARARGLRISYGDLRFAGLKLKGGLCEFRGETWVVMDRRQPFDDQVDIFREALNGREFTEELGPDLKKILNIDAPAA
ncbi:MAG: hypothetical protein HQK55_18570 [Deltaproteobacteria bacterium]|nr:hypothetical protein [Deltaproteobacteria bacterium]